MSRGEEVKILLVDDEADEQKSTFELQFTTEATEPRARHPQDVDMSHLEWADIVLMDYRIDHWPERDNATSLGLQPLHGVALATIYREYIDRLEGKESLTAIAVHTGHLRDRVDCRSVEQ